MSFISIPLLIFQTQKERRPPAKRRQVPVEDLQDDSVNSVVTLPAVLAPSTSSTQVSTLLNESNLLQVLQDHNYAMTDSPRGIKRKLNYLYDELEKSKKKCRINLQRVRRLKKRVEDLSAVVASLKKKQLVSDSCATLLNSVAKGVPRDVVKQLIKTNTDNKEPQYSEELKAFAMTLQFYSNKAYDYVRKTFGLCLPHPRTIRKWYSKTDGEPGFTQSAFSALRRHVKVSNDNAKEVVCSLMIDEMSIHKHLDVKNGKCHGFVYIGNGII